MIDVSIVILTLNEASSIESVISRSIQELNSLVLTFEIVIVDGGSRDGTREKAEALGARVLLQKRPGYGGALIEGLLACGGEYVVTLDADGSHPPDLISRLWEQRHSNELLVASRYVPGGKSYAPLFRRVLSRLLCLTVSRVLSLPVKDVSSGFRLYKSSALSPEMYRCEHFDILQEILLGVYAEGYGIGEVPLVYQPRRGGDSHARILSFGIAYLSLLPGLWRLRNSAGCADYDHRAFDSLIPLQRHWQRRRYAIVQEFVARATGPVLDVGCGSSRIVQSLPDAIAFDISASKLRFLKRSNKFRVEGSTSRLPFRANSLGTVIHSQVIKHVPFDIGIFRELNRVLKKQGILVIGTPDYGRRWWPIIEYFYRLLLPEAYGDQHITNYTRNRLFHWLAENEFRILEYRYICGAELIVEAVKLRNCSQQNLDSSVSSN